LAFFQGIFEIILAENESLSRDELFAVQFIPFDLLLGLIDYCVLDQTYKRNKIRSDKTIWKDIKVPFYFSFKP